MCPEFERLERVVQKDVWGPEHDDAGAVAEPRMVKKFRRAAAGIDEQLPSDLRPPSTLKLTVDYLFNDIVANAASLGSVHHFVWDRTRAIRNDFSIQQITKPADVEIAIDCYERIARFHMLSLHQLALPEKPYDKYDWYQEREQLDRTLLSLMQYYDDSRGRVDCKNEAEFRAYLIIFQAQDPTPDLDERVNTWPLSVKSDRRIRIALDLNSAASNVVDPQGPLKPRALYPVAREDWSQFFDLVRSNKVSYLMACVSEIYFKLVRRTALNSIWRGFKGQVHDFTVLFMTQILGFDYPEQTVTFCQHFGFVFKTPSSGGEPFLDLDSVKGKTFPVETPGLDHQTFSQELVEAKRMGRNFSAVISGYTVADAQSSGLIDHSYDSQMEEQMEDNVDVSSADEDSDSLFVPQDAPKPTLKAPSTSPFSFAPTKPASEGQAPPPFLQSKPITSSFGQPSTSTGFSFGKPSVNQTRSEAPTFAAPPFPTGQSLKSDTLSPLASPFTPASPTTTPGTVTNVEHSNKSSASSLFPTKFGTTSDGSSSSPSLTKPTIFPSSGPSNASSPLGTTTTSTVKQPTSTASASSIFSIPTSQEHPKPSFSFPSTSQPVAQPNVPPSNNPFGASLPTSDASVASKLSLGSTAFTQPSTPLFTKPVADSPSLTPPPPSPVSTVNGVSSVTPTGASPFGSKLTQSNFIQSSQPKKPSPLSQSYSPDDSAEATPAQGLAAEAQQDESASSVLNLPVPASKQPAVVPSSNAPKSKDEILQRLASEIVLDFDRGLIRQFVEYQVGQTMSEVYNEIYMETQHELADTFRRETLSYRYGKRWREICWRRRLARQGRERRKRAKKDQSVRELKRKHAAERDAVDDFLKSTSSAGHAGASTHEPPARRHDHSARDAEHGTERGVSTHPYAHRRPESHDDIDVQTPKRKQSAPTPRSNFLGFSMMGSQNRPAITSTPSRSNYFRLKALGINPINPSDEPAAPPQTRKRLREDSEEASAETCTSRKRTRTPPAAAEDTLTAQPSKLGGHGLSGARQEDEELFARARAARQAMAESSAWYQSEMQKDAARRKEDMARSLTSSSMERARQAARSKAIATPPDVPAYRLRESRFVPRDQYKLAVTKAKLKIETRSQSPFQSSTPGIAKTWSRSAEKRWSTISTPNARQSLMEEQETQAADSMAQLAALHKVPEHSAWQYEPTFFTESIDPVLSEPNVNEYLVSDKTSRSSPDGALESVARDAMNGYVDIASDSESDGLAQDESQGHGIYDVADMVNVEADDDEEDEEEEDDEDVIGGYAQDPEGYEDLESFDEEEEEEEEEGEEEVEEEEENFDDSDDDEESEEGLSNSRSLSAEDGNSNIKAGTGTADDAFELSD
jgi:hypothetical protein